MKPVCPLFSSPAVTLGREAALAAALALFVTALPTANAAVSGNVITHKAPSGVEERCVILNRMPDGVYSNEDKQQEKAFCAIDFYTGDHALCPKVFSTSPGTLVYDISKGPFKGKPEAFEREQCATSSPIKRGALGEPISFKMTMNARTTSGTFSTASLLYYHFARYLDAAVHVPVSVYRSMDKNAHLQRVAKRGFELSAHRKGGAMNHAGWKIMREADANPSSYKPTDELFTADRKQVYGILIHPEGDRYSAEINGTRKSGWGEGQNRDFQETAPFRALRADQPLHQAIETGIHKASADPTLRKAMGHGVSPQQMVFWMQELTEITLLDYIFSQQDRIGNIDYLPYWYWVQDAKVHSRPASGSKVPEDIAAHHPMRLRRSQLNDNDAGGRHSYANFTKKTGMLDKIRHYNPDTYRRLSRLDRDFTAGGELYRYVQESFGLSKTQLEQLVENIHQAAGILRASCRAGKLRFDLDPESFLVVGKALEHKVDCDNP